MRFQGLRYSLPEAMAFAGEIDVTWPVTDVGQSANPLELSFQDPQPTVGNTRFECNPVVVGGYVDIVEVPSLLDSKPAKLHWWQGESIMRPYHQKVFCSSGLLACEVTRPRSYLGKTQRYKNLRQSLKLRSSCPLPVSQWATRPPYEPVITR